MLRFKKDDGAAYPDLSVVKLSDFSKRVTRKNKNNETNIPLTIASLHGLVDQRTYFNRTVASADMSNYYLLKNGEFAYNKSYSNGFDYGAIKRLDKYPQGALSTLYICFSLKDNVDSDYMTHYFDSQKWNSEVAIRCAEGARNHGLLNIGVDDFFDISLNIHSSIEEQRKIADFLSSVDEVIKESEKEVANLEAQKKGAMQKIFSQEIRFKADDGSEYPEWEENILKDLVGKISSGKDKVDEGTAILYGSMGPIGKCKSPTYCGRKILVARVGANAGTVNIIDIDCGVSDNTLIIKDTDNCCLDWLYYDLTNKNIGKMRFGGGQPLVTGGMLQDLTIITPCIEEQQKIADFLSSFDEVIDYAKQELELWKNIKKGLLQQMFE